MKKLLVLFCSAGVLFMAGCGSEKVTPEDVGKQYMEQRFTGAEANLTDLAYTVVDAGDDMATVAIEGTITYKEKIFLKKKNGKWAVTDEAPAATEDSETSVVVAEVAPVNEEAVEHAPAVEALEHTPIVEPLEHSPIVEDVEHEPAAEPVKEVHDAPAESHAPAEEVVHH